ncbi:unnamed protein product [Polarella glacialis]|uniref:Uncharacterized protein n=1 Tax=Polarella glacialis TaxID=89957 RepID=A0A813FEE8_POLGL|nr:unnamed protein product [Polarella glacialis]
MAQVQYEELEASLLVPREKWVDVAVGSFQVVRFFSGLMLLFLFLQPADLPSLRFLHGRDRRLSTPTPNNWSTMPFCSLHGRDCQTTHCCSMPTDTCFQRNLTWARCRASCKPGVPDPAGARWSCLTPFEDIRAIARRTELWPDIIAVCSPGVALVEHRSFYAQYRGSCLEFCVDGAGKAVDPAGHKFWISVERPGEIASHHCVGDKEGNYSGVRLAEDTQGSERHCKEQPEKEEEVEVEEQQEETAVAQEVVAEIQLVEAMASPVAEQVELVHEVSWPQVEEKPKSWAAMAGKLRQEGPGKLAPKPKGTGDRTSCSDLESNRASRASAKALAFVYLNSGSDKSGSDDSGHNNSGPDSSGSDNAGSDNFGSDISGSNHSGSDFSGCPGLPLRSLRSSSLCSRASLLTCMPLDRACCGRTGNHADQLLGDLLGLPARVGMADNLHCYNTAGIGIEDRDEEVGVNRSVSLFTHWVEFVGKFRSKFRRGINKGLLEEAFCILVTWFTIYIAGFLGQSIRHYRARYIAAASALETYVLDVCLHLPHGFIKTAQSSQAVAQVFFPIVLANVGVFWHLHFLGCYSAQLGRLRARLELQLVNDPDLQTFADTPAGHPQRVFRPARSWGTQALAAAGAPGVLANMRHRLDALGLRQPGAQPQPLEALLAMARIGAELAQHLVGWRNDGAQLGAVRSGWLEPKEWLAAIFAVLPAAFGVLQGSAEAWQSRRAVAAIRAADEVVPAVSKTMSYFAALAGKFEVTVLQSHGTHIPFEVRGAATLLFWAPDILANPVNANGSFELGDLAGMQLLGSFRQWVSKMIPTYYWPGDDVLLEQYRVLTRAWKQAVLDDLAVKADVWETRVDGTFAFCWPGFWKQAHVDSRFAPASASAARQLFHYTGSFGVST